MERLGLGGWKGVESIPVPEPLTEVKGKQSIIYVSDFATKRNEGLDGLDITGGKILQTFIKKYKENYLDKNNPVPILMEARESTSYRLLERQLPSISRKLNAEIEMKVVEEYDSGGEKFNRVLLIVRPKESGAIVESALEPRLGDS